MQPSRPSLFAPRPGNRPPATRLLALLLLLALQAAAAAPAGSRTPEDSEWLQDAELPQGLLSQAARAALHFFNFRAGSPSALRVLAEVQEGSAWINQRKERKVDLVFTAELYNTEEGKARLGKCSAQVFFRNEKPRPAVNVTCTQLLERKKRQEEDYQLYRHMKQLNTPLDVVSIPDGRYKNSAPGKTHLISSCVQKRNAADALISFNANDQRRTKTLEDFAEIITLDCRAKPEDSHGHIDPSLRPIWDLAFLGSSYVMWEKTTQFLHYYVSQLSSVKQWKTNDDAIDFDYTVLLHEFSTQEIIPCRIHLVWYPGKPLKVKYHCQELQTPEASGTEEGSAVAPIELSNF